MKCKHCNSLKNLTRHSLTGGHKPPFVILCVKCHQKIHGIKEKKQQFHQKNSKIKKGTKLRKKRGDPKNNKGKWK